MRRNNFSAHASHYQPARTRARRLVARQLFTVAALTAHGKQNPNRKRKRSVRGAGRQHRRPTSGGAQRWRAGARAHTQVYSVQCPVYSVQCTHKLVLSGPAGGAAQARKHQPAALLARKLGRRRQSEPKKRMCKGTQRRLRCVCVCNGHEAPLACALCNTSNMFQLRAPDDIWQPDGSIPLFSLAPRPAPRANK